MGSDWITLNNIQVGRESLKIFNKANRALLIIHESLKRLPHELPLKTQVSWAFESRSEQNLIYYSLVRKWCVGVGYANDWINVFCGNENKLKISNFTIFINLNPLRLELNWRFHMSYWICRFVLIQTDEIHVQVEPCRGDPRQGVETKINFELEYSWKKIKEDWWGISMSLID